MSIYFNGETYDFISVSVAGGGGGEAKYSVEEKTETWQHNTYVTISVDIGADGSVSAYKSAGGGTANNMVICYPQSDTYVAENEITKIPFPKQAGTYELPISVWWDNQSGAHNDHNNHTLTYTVIKGRSQELVYVEPLTITENGTYNAPDDVAYSPISVNVPTGGGGDVDTATVTPSANATTVAITGLNGVPKWFVFTPNSNVTGASNSRRITSHIYDGTSDFGQNLYGSGSWSATYTVQKNTTNFSHTYSNGTLTLNSGGANAGGAYQNVAHTLIYGY